MALEMHQNLEIIVLGGTLNHKYMVNMGSEVANKVAKIRPDYYLMGMYNIDVSAGLTVPTFEESLLKKQMAEVATETISLATSDKLDTISTYVIGPINMLDTMITTVKDTEAYAEAGIKVLYCEDDE
ncbi:hypothetical protein I588_01159 [Enterococcus pallens ATCC BAA-351]|uniref:DeoR-like transcriptional repressor C-terminal sensor domain-containing protein n=1 Tax=Enterococcus pallens ATCC BAA-351 TaxID=1158607 RepID=R2Q904_9ENTE|nr:hypothetical protein UAU_03045 [Enterococcus pallens ATCC BAA-351]EOU25171.1 hypothetical protein I588_01159 [Enterococcus pallens ATCC BAA-351]OJG76072.1 hypothetical protein RV10_GL004250 [Enterococcus pallens]